MAGVFLCFDYLIVKRYNIFVDRYKKLKDGILWD